jgi:pSer/pThr/pTyr-binding forkhead associated (FHA) protein
LQDLGSANGTYYNGARVEGAITLTPSGRVQIGETEIVFRDKVGELASATVDAVDMPAAVPEATIAFNSSHRTTSGLLEAIEGARTQGLRARRSSSSPRRSGPPSRAICSRSSARWA